MLQVKTRRQRPKLRRPEPTPLLVRVDPAPQPGRAGGGGGAVLELELESQRRAGAGREREARPPRPTVGRARRAALTRLSASALAWHMRAMSSTRSCSSACAEVGSAAAPVLAAHTRAASGEISELVAWQGVHVDARRRAAGSAAGFLFCKKMFSLRPLRPQAVHKPDSWLYWLRKNTCIRRGPCKT